MDSEKLNPLGVYYLHTNGSLIHKSFWDSADWSDFVVRVWFDRVIGKSPQTFVAFLAEAKIHGANDEEINRLARHNELDRFAPDWRKTVYTLKAVN